MLPPTLRKAHSARDLGVYREGVGDGTEAKDGRLPARPLYEAAAARLGRQLCVGHGRCSLAHSRQHVGVIGVARVLKVSPTTGAAWWRDGVPVIAADDCAIRLGLHPAMLWADYYMIEPTRASPSLNGRRS